MSTDEIKAMLHESIENIDDNDLLLTIKELLERKYTPSVSPTLTDWQKHRLNESEEQIKQGRSFSDDEANQIINKWLSE